MWQKVDEVFYAIKWFQIKTWERSIAKWDNSHAIYIFAVKAAVYPFQESVSIPVSSPQEQCECLGYPKSNRSVKLLLNS